MERYRDTWEAIATKAMEHLDSNRPTFKEMGKMREAPDTMEDACSLLYSSNLHVSMGTESCPLSYGFQNCAVDNNSHSIDASCCPLAQLWDGANLMEDVQTEPQRAFCMSQYWLVEEQDSIDTTFGGIEPLATPR